MKFEKASPSLNVPVSQPAEEPDLKSAQCGFESHLGHQQYLVPHLFFIKVTQQTIVLFHVFSSSFVLIPYGFVAQLVAASDF